MRDSHRRLLRLFRPLVPLLVGTTLSLFFSVLFVELMGRFLSRDSESYRGPWIMVGFVFMLILWLCCYLAPIVVAIYGIVGAFARRSRTELLLQISVTYISLILCAAGVYYSMTVVDDYNDEGRKYTYYNIIG